MDKQIIALLEARDEQALAFIREQYGKLCETVACRMLGNRQDAEECVSDMLLDVWRGETLPEPEGLRGYLVMLVRRRAIDRLKAQNAEKRGGTQFSLALDELAEILPAAEQVEQTVELRELTAALTAFLHTLPPDTKRIFMQRYYLSESIDEIAAQNGMSRSAVKMSLHRTRKKLRDHLRKEGLL